MNIVETIAIIEAGIIGALVGWFVIYPLVKAWGDMIDKE